MGTLGQDVRYALRNLRKTPGFAAVAVITMGVGMQPAEYEPGAPPVFVLRYKTWVKSFGADPGIVNKTFVLNGVQRTLIGIMPPRFGWGNADLWIPAKPSRAPTGKVIAGAFQ